MPPTAPLVLAVLFLVQLAFASLSIVGKVAMTVVPSTALMVVRAAGGALVFAALALVRREPVLPPRASWRTVGLLGFLGVFANQGCYLAGLHRTTAINATVLVATSPLFTALFAVVSGRERLHRGFVLGLAVAVAGTLLVVRPERYTWSDAHVLGDALVVTNALAYGLYLALGRDAVVRHGASSVVRWVFLAGALMALPVGGPALYATAPAFSARMLAVLAYILVVPTAFAYAANAWCLGRAPASVVSVYIYFQPVLATVMALVAGPPLARWLGSPVPAESLTLRTVIGGVAVLAGVALASRKPRSA